MASSPPLAEQQHRDRAGRHLVIGEALESAGDEWAVVPLFYASYHLVKAALLIDPIWDDANRRTAVHVELTPADRFVTRHHGRRVTGNGRHWGINELVLKLYPVIVQEYERLHQASIQVRYGAGLPSDALPALRVDVDHVCAQSAAGALTA